MRRQKSTLGQSIVLMGVVGLGYYIFTQQKDSSSAATASGKRQRRLSTDATGNTTATLITTERTVLQKGDLYVPQRIWGRHSQTQQKALQMWETSGLDYGSKLHKNYLGTLAENAEIDDLGVWTGRLI